MFASVRGSMPGRQGEIQASGIEVTQMAPEISEKFKNSLKSRRWNKIDLGAAQNYTHENMVNRWVIEKNKWLNKVSCGFFRFEVR